MAKYTIITVVKNDVKNIASTINSVLQQTEKDFEYIVIDGSSGDGTLEEIKRLQDNIDLIISEDDRGIYDAMNKGVRHANGDWVIFINSGDAFYTNTVLEIISNQLEGDYVYGKIVLYDLKNEREFVVAPRKRSIRGLPYCHQALFLRREIIREYLFDSSYKIAADYDQYLRMLLNGKEGKSVDLIVSKVLAGGVSQTHHTVLLREYYNVLRAYKPIYSYFLLLFRLMKLILRSKRACMMDLTLMSGVGGVVSRDEHER